VAGLGVAAAAYGLRLGVQQWAKMAARPAAAAYYKGGFQREMDRKEAALILGLRGTATVRRRRRRARRPARTLACACARAALAAPPRQPPAADAPL